MPGRAVVLSLARLNRIRKSMRQPHHDRGCRLHPAQIQQAAAAEGCLFPLSLAAEGSCTIGGNLSTNAGGTAVLRYGNTRELCLGLEVVTAQGEIWDGLRGLRKDNTGYDLRDLYIGAEGTLGIITGAVLKLYPQPQAITALAPWSRLPRRSTAGADAGPLRCQPDGFRADVALCLRWWRNSSRPAATLRRQHGSMCCWNCRAANRNSMREPARTCYRRGAGTCHHQRCRGGDLGGAIAGAVAVARTHPAGQAKAGKNIKHDISLPVSRIADFIATTEPLLERPSPPASWSASAIWATAICTSMLRRPRA
jgi:FAD/FMN-containing dehydrogenase